MDCIELIKDVRAVPFVTLRADSEDFFEVVILNDSVGALCVKLEKFFGQPAIPSKNKLSDKIEKTIKLFGGINPGQTLYYWNEGDNAIFAMLWPWQDKTHTTLKIIKL
ncbi:MAG: hypothetical protein WBI28_00660 [Candidatus Omnitrophota bacterium]